MTNFELTDKLFCLTFEKKLSQLTPFGTSKGSAGLEHVNLYNKAKFHA